MGVRVQPLRHLKGADFICLKTWEGFPREGFLLPRSFKDTSVSQQIMFSNMTRLWKTLGVLNRPVRSLFTFSLAGFRRLYSRCAVRRCVRKVSAPSLAPEATGLSFSFPRVVPVLDARWRQHPQSRSEPGDRAQPRQDEKGHAVRKKQATFAFFIAHYFSNTQGLWAPILLSAY